METSRAQGMVRRAACAMLRAWAWGVLALAMLVLLLWLVGRIASDRWIWSQYLFWLPTPVAIAAGAVPGAIAWAAWRLAGRRGRRGRSCRRFARAQWAFWAGWGLALVWMVGAEWRMYRAVGGIRSDAPSEGLRLVYWNPATPIPGFVERMSRVEADLYAIANQPGHRDVEDLREVLLERGAGWTSVRAGRMACVSRHPIRRWGFMRLGLEGQVWFGDPLEVEGREIVRTDAGRALFVEVAWEGRPLVIWIVDLPSDPLLPRPALLREARAAIESWRGTVLTVTEETWRQPVEREGRFPEPDVIVGDLNTPRGSWSLRGLVGSMRGGFEQAGWGHGGTFPRRLPLWHIDQLFTGRHVRVAAYDTFDPGVSLHCGQRAVLLPREDGVGE